MRIKRRNDVFSFYLCFIIRLYYKPILDYLIESQYVKLKECPLKIKKVYDNKLSYTKERLFDLIVLTLFDINQIKNKEHILALNSINLYYLKIDNFSLF